MDTAAQLLTALLGAYNAQSISLGNSTPIAQSAPPEGANAAQASAFEYLLAATRSVGHELVSALASKAALERILDQLPIGLVLVTADLKVLSTNKPARKLVADGDALDIVKGRLRCMDERSHQKLEQGIQRLHTKVRGVTGSVAIRVTRGSDQSDLQLHIAANDGLHLLPNAVDTPACCIWVFDPTSYKKIDCELLRELHGLTVSEAAVTSALFRGLSIDEVATELGVSVNTVKTHLRHIFQKCEVRSQAELLQMLALGPR